MTRYPLVFTYVDVVDGRGFSAQVIARGRATLTDAGDGWWVDGVNPGALAESSTRPHDAVERFGVSFRSMLEQLAMEAAGFSDFDQTVQSFFSATHDESLLEWHAAVADGRKASAPVLLPYADADRALVAVEVSLAAAPCRRRLSEMSVAIAA